jgi:hypothetical protein
MPLPDDFCPFVGLRPYVAADVDFFFGRDTETRAVADHLFGARVTVLYGASGVGKSSLLMAGVLPALAREEAVATVVYRDWQAADAPAQLRSAIVSACEHSAGRPLGLDAAAPLDTLLAAASAAIDGTVLLILDQFEEYFLYFPDAEAGLDAELARAMTRRDVDAGFLLSLREDALSRLDRLKRRVPTLLANTVQLEHLSNDQARKAIRLPVQRYVERGASPGAPVAVDDGLVEAVIDQTTPGRLALGGSGGTGLAQDTGHVEAPYLQLVLERLWAEEQRLGSGRLTAKTLGTLGGAERIVHEHLNAVADRLSPDDQALCARVLDRLVTPSGAKIAARVVDLGTYAGAMRDALPALITALERSRVLTRIRAPAGQPPEHDQVQILHDVMAAGALAWRKRYLEHRAAERVRAAAERRIQVQARRQRWLLLSLIGVVLAAAAMGALYLRAEKAYEAAEAAAQAAQEERNRFDARLIAERTALAAAAPAMPASAPAPAAASASMPVLVGRGPAAVPNPLPAARPPVRVLIYEAAVGQRGVGERLRTAMAASGFDVPPVEKVASVPQRTDVRHVAGQPDDAKSARTGAELLRRWGFGTVDVQVVAVSAQTVRPGQFEVWIARPDPAELRDLAERVAAPDYTVRVGALGKLERNATASPAAIEAVLALLAPDRLDGLSSAGRFNALYFLSRSSPLAWDGELYARGRSTVAMIEQRGRAGVAIGSNTRLELQRVSALLDAVRDGRPLAQESRPPE